MKNRVKNQQIARGSRLFKRFTGRAVSSMATVEVPPLPKTGLAIGKILGIMYETVRDGKQERYLHKFKASSRPLFVVSHDGKQLLIVGGQYNFTERGIVDKR
jgi:hypothetical protein